jgi:hypothetical protein
MFYYCKQYLCMLTTYHHSLAWSRGPPIAKTVSGSPDHGLEVSTSACSDSSSAFSLHGPVKKK